MERECVNGEWRALWEQYGDRLLIYARQQAPTLGDAEDIVQEAFVRFWRSQSTDPGLSPALLFQMVRRIAIDHARQVSSRAAREAEALRRVADEPALFRCPAEDRERTDLIEDAMRALPKPQREVLTLKIWGGLTFEQIGAVLEVPPNTAASRYRYGLNQLRQTLAPAIR
jgi:RNA polymerase sigma-70 factor (ECF subfamily)